MPTCLWLFCGCSTCKFPTLLAVSTQTWTRLPSKRGRLSLLCSVFLGCHSTHPQKRPRRRLGLTWPESLLYVSSGRRLTEGELCTAVIKPSLENQPRVVLCKEVLCPPWRNSQSFSLFRFLSGLKTFFAFSCIIRLHALLAKFQSTMNIRGLFFRLYFPRIDLPRLSWDWRKWC